jgi:hypothetical protein
MQRIVKYTSYTIKHQLATLQVPQFASQYHLLVQHIDLLVQLVQPIALLLVQHIDLLVQLVQPIALLLVQLVQPIALLLVQLRY